MNCCFARLLDVVQKLQFKTWLSFLRYLSGSLLIQRTVAIDIFVRLF